MPRDGALHARMGSAEHVGKSLRGATAFPFAEAPL